MAKYIYQEKTIRVAGKPLVHPKFAHVRKMNSKTFVRHASHGNRDREISLSAAIAQLAEELACVLAEGRSVELEGIGLFSPNLRMKKGREVMSEDAEGGLHQSNAQSVEFGTVRFAPARELVRKCRSNCRHLEHDSQTGDSKIRLNRSTLPERVCLLQEHLQREDRITVSQYAQLTGISSSAASRELRKLHCSDSPIIARSGRASHAFYTKMP